MSRDVLQNTTRGFPIYADDSTSFGDAKLSLTITAKLSKNGGTLSSVAPTITEIGEGNYWVVPLAAHRDTLGMSVWSFTATGAKIGPSFEAVVAYDSQVAPPTAAEIRAEMDSASTKLAEITATRMAALTDLVDGGRLDLLIDAIKTASESVKADIDNGGRTDLILDALTTALASVIKSGEPVAHSRTGRDSVTVTATRV